MRDYKTLPDYPSQYSAETVLIRLLDGIGFRYQVALDGIQDEHLEYKPADGAMTILEQQEHIFNILNWVYQSIIELESDYDFSIKNSFIILNELRDIFEKKSYDLNDIRIRELPFWHVINGPFADILTHIGQINSYKRMIGIPNPKINYFSG